MTEVEDIDYYRLKFAKIRENRDMLDPESLLREVMSDDVFEKLDRLVERSDVESLLRECPFAIGFALGLSVEHLRDFDTDIRRVYEKTHDSRQRNVLDFLRAERNAHKGTKYGGLFEVWAKSSASKSGFCVEFDSLLPNGRDHDIKLKKEVLRRF